MMSAAQEVDVPEPSPLFWDHLSSRVSAAVAAEDAAARLKPSRFGFLAGRWLLWPSIAGVAAVLSIAVALGSRVMAPGPSSAVAPPPAVFVAQAPPPAVELLGDPADDVSLMLVASLTDAVDLDTVHEAGLATRGSAEAAITHMNESELRELGRLLKEELARSGA
jgi:hypothetical protein